MAEDKEKDDKITLVMEDGTEKEYRILFTHHSDEFNKDYVLFYPAEQEDAEEIDIIPAAYKQDGSDTGDLTFVTEDAEWEMLEQVLADFQKEATKDEE